MGDKDKISIKYNKMAALNSKIQLMDNLPLEYDIVFCPYRRSKDSI
jgi:hypothetical protein